ncbi:hypothetical protein LTR85_009346 [Meristemomyces frigidus]|nr:hypothetical protein LTR85_009346 [Meristemomyces frigidus]
MAEAASNTTSADAQAAASPNAAAGTLQETLSSSPPSHDAIANTSLPAFPSSSKEERNQAPGILDRRKSTKPASRSQSRSTRGAKVRGPPIRITMADVGVEMKAKDGETPGVEDTFEDAPDTTPRPTSTEPATNGHMEGTKINGGAGSAGLAIEGATDAPQSTVETKDGAQDADAEPRMSARLSKFGSDDPMLYGGDGAGSEASHSRQSTLDMPPPPRPDRERSTSPTKQMQGLSGDFAVGTPPPPSTADRARALDQRHVGERPAPTPSPGIARKASSGFAGLLGRMGSIRKPARSPPAPRQDSRFMAERRNTGVSVVSVDSNVNGLASIADGPESTPRPSLQDQFQSLRRQEEYTMSGANGHAVNGDAERVSVVRMHSDADVLSPTKAGQDGDPRMERALSTPGLLKSPDLNPSLPPGTASGLAAGPAEEPRPVNWDLWQSVVYEGPAAVRRTSGKELREAIACGIPAALRGVVWQVLAESKSEELEQIYRTLKTRGTDAEQQLRPAPMSRSESQTNGLNGGAEHHSVSSSRSSVHSESSSTPATSAMTSPPPSVEGNVPDLQAKLIAEKQKRDAAAVSKLEKAIKRDLGSRTSFSKYTQSAGLQDGLLGVCKAYALFDEGVGYAQGINFIAMPLLFNMSEDESFTLLVRLMSKYDLRSLFTADMAGLHLRLYQFERLLEDLEPALYCHLKRRHVGPQLYATQWFLTLFAYRFPLQLVLRVYDLIFSEGLTAILKFGIVLMQRNREALLEMKDMSHLTTFLKEKIFDVYIDKSPSASSLLDSGFFGSVTGGADKELYRADEMVRDACDVKITDEELALYAAEWEHSQRLERERTEEMETLRSFNTQLTSRIKALEERTQQQDTEHVAIASDLVKLKVQNDSLLDENEGLKMKVEELQKIADAQPAEVEQKLKEEMDRIMQRNIEVQNENRALKEECEEMEQELVGAKMKHAQAQSDHDALQQRWANVQAAMNA